MSWDSISNAIESFRDGPRDASIQIGLIIIFALVASKASAIAITRVVNRATKKSRAINFSDLRNMTDTGTVTEQLLGNRASQRANALGSLALSTAVIVIGSVAVVTIMIEIGINVGPLLVSTGVFGVVLGFGAKTLVAANLAGISMALEGARGDAIVVRVMAKVVPDQQFIAARLLRERIKGALDNAGLHFPLVQMQFVDGSGVT